MSKKGNLKIFYTQRGNARYEIKIWHDGLQQHQVIHGTNQNDVLFRAQQKMEQWDRFAERADKKQLAIERTKEAKEALQTLETILISSLSENPVVNWESLKNHSSYGVPQPQQPEVTKPGWLTRIIPSMKTKYEREVSEQQEKYKASLDTWQKDKNDYEKECAEHNALIDEKKRSYLEKSTGGLIDYCDIVLSNSSYPDYFPQSYDLDYNLNSKLLIVDYRLPAVENIQTLQEVSYI